MKKSRHITAFYAEALVLILVFIGIILVLTRIFGAGRVKSGDARLLTQAVTLAANTAELVNASESAKDLADRLNEAGNAALSDGGGVPAVTACYGLDLEPDAAGALKVLVTWEEAAGTAGTMVNSRITVLYEGREAPVYELDTAVYVKGGAKD